MGFLNWNSIWSNNEKHYNSSGESPFGDINVSYFAEFLSCIFLKCTEAVFITRQHLKAFPFYAFIVVELKI